MIELPKYTVPTYDPRWLAAELMARMAEDVKDASLKVEDIVDRYVKTATPELRQQLIDKLTEIRKEKFVIE